MIFALIRLVDLLFTLYILMFIVRAIASWINPYARHPILIFVNYATEPLLRPIRSILPPTGQVDFSPLVATLILIVLERAVVGLLAALM